MAFPLKSSRLSRFFTGNRVRLLFTSVSIALLGISQPGWSQSNDAPATAQKPRGTTAGKAPQKAESGTDVQADAIQFDPNQTEPLLAINRQQLVNRRLAYRPVFELSADGKLINRRGSTTEKTIQLTPEETQSILRQAINEAKFFSLDGATFQKQFAKAAMGNKSFRVKDQVITKVEVKVKQGQKTLAIRGYSLARLKLTELTDFQKLTAVESMCEYLIAKNVVGDRAPVVLAAINAEIKKRKLSMREVKAKDLRAAYERKGGRFQARYLGLTKPNVDAETSKGTDEKFEAKPIQITYFVKSEGAEPTIRFFGNTGE
jgi:hypothetical protein